MRREFPFGMEKKTQNFHLISRESKNPPGLGWLLNPNPNFTRDQNKLTQFNQSKSIYSTEEILMPKPSWDVKPLSSAHKVQCMLCYGGKIRLRLKDINLRNPPKLREHQQPRKHLTSLTLDSNHKQQPEKSRTTYIKK